MPSIDFSRLNRPAADRWRDFIEAQADFRLNELRDWLAADGGPLVAADGSWGSLEPVWAWAVDFARRGGQALFGEPWRRSSRMIAFGIETSQLTAVPAIGEDLGYYCFEVLRGLRPDTAWTVFSSPPGVRVPDFDHQHTGISAGHSWAALDAALPNMLRSALRGKPATASSAALQNVLGRLFEVDEEERGNPPKTSWTLETTEKTEVAIPVPDLTNEIDRSPAPENAGTLSALLSEGANDYDLDHGAGIDRGAVIGLLEQLNFVPFEAPQGDALTVPSPKLVGWIYDRGVDVETYGEGDKISAVVFDPAVISSSEWKALTKALRAFAREQGCKFQRLRS